MPFYISTLIFKALLLLLLSFSIPLCWGWSKQELQQSLIDFRRRVRAVTSSLSQLSPTEVRTSHFFSSWVRIIGSEMWERNHIWRAVWIAGAGCGSFLPHHCCHAIFDTWFAYTQHGACISLNVKENEHSDKDGRDNNPASQSHACYRHKSFNSLLYILPWCGKGWNKLPRTVNVDL